jgi:tRNA(Ile)-lysidine synthase
MLARGRRIVAGFSGGADSSALLRVLLELRGELGLTLFAAHVNHGLRGEESDGDERFCAETCAALGVPLRSFRFDCAGFAARNRLTLEEAGRVRRYAFFEEARTEFGADAIAVAHNLDDQAETLIMRLARGTGTAGLRGIPSVSGTVIRPLLAIGRAEIERYLESLGQPFRTDATNADTDYARNRVRHKIMPALRAINPEASAALARSARQFADEDALLTEMAQAAYPGALTAESLLAARPVLRARMARIFIAELTGALTDVSFAHAESLVDLALGGTGRRVALPGGIVVENRYGTVAAVRYRAAEYRRGLPVPGETLIPETGASVSASPDPPGLALSAQKARHGLVVRSRSAGDRISIRHIGTQSVKKFFIDAKIPRERRARIPLIVDESGGIAAVGDIRADARFEPEGGEDIIYINVKYSSGES